MAAESPPGRASSLAQGALLGLCVTAGWLLNDVARYATSGQPEVFLTLVPGSLVALAVGTLLGALAGRLKLLVVAYLAAGLGAFAWPKTALEVIGPLGGFGTHDNGALLAIAQGRTLALWSLAWLLTSAARRFDLAPARAGCSLGVLGAIAAGFVTRAEHYVYDLAPFWKVPAAAATAVLLLGWLRMRHRGWATASVVLVAALLTARRGYPETRVSYWRDDLPPPDAPASEGANLVLVVLDTVRAQSLAPYGRERVTSPELDEWVREHATIFAQARSTSSFTLASHGSLFTGVLPAQHQAARLRPSAGPLSKEFPTLAERLCERGYQTAAIVANHTYLHPQFGMDRGFEHFDLRNGSLVEHYLPLAQLTGRRLWAGHLSYRDAHSITDSALAWLERRRAPQPFFLMLNYLDAHTPYLPRPPHDMEFEDVRLVNHSGVPPEYDELAYERNIHYLDTQVGRLLRAIEAHGLFEDTLIVITSDHGEAFGEHGFLEHCWTLYEEVLKVPLYVKPSGGRRAVRDDRPINSADLTWLMLDELGVPYEQPVATDAPQAEWYRQVPMTPNYLALAVEIDMDLDRDLVAWFEAGRKVIVSTAGTVEAYALESDPHELRPLELSQAEVERALARATAWWQAHPLAAKQTEVIPAEEMGRLRALGYAGGGE